MRACFACLHALYSMRFRGVDAIGGCNQPMRMDRVVGAAAPDRCALCGFT